MISKSDKIRLIGEFLVVFLSILLAFSIDRWWESRKLKSEERFALETIREDLVKDTSVFISHQIPTNSDKLEQIQILLKMMREGADFTKAENLELGKSVMGMNNWSVSRTAYNSYKSHFNIIRDKEIRRALVNYYEASSQNCDYANEAHIDYYKTKIVPYLLDNSDLMVVGNSAKMIKDIGFFNRVVLLESVIQLKVREYKKVTEISKELITMIDEYLG